MRRFLIFLGFGPPLGLIIFFSLETALGVNLWPLLFLSFYVGLLPFAYFLGGGPALFSACADWLLSDTFSRWPRIAVLSAIGYDTTLLWVFPTEGNRQFSYLTLAFGLVGAVPAAVCSWWSDEAEIHGAMFWRKS